MKKENLVKRLNSGVYVSENMIKPFNNDKEVLLLYLKKNSSYYRNIDKKLNGDKELAEICLRMNANLIQYSSTSLRNDKDFILKSCHNLSFAVKFLSRRLLNEEDFIYKLLVDNKNYEIYSYLSNKWKDNLMIVNKMIDENIHFSPFIGKKIRNDTETIKKILKKDGTCLKFLSREQKNNKNIVDSAFLKNDRALIFVGKKLRDNDDFMYELVKKNGLNIQYASSRIRNQKKWVMLAIENNLLALNFLPVKFQKDKDVILEINKSLEKVAKKNLKLSLRGLPDDLKNNRDFIKRMLANNVEIFQDINKDFYKDKEICLLAIKNMVWNYNLIDETLLYDEDILTTLINVWSGFVTLSPKLKNNKKIILMAVKKDFSNYNDISAILQQDDDIVKEGIRANQKIIEYIHVENINNTDFLVKVLELLENKNQLYDLSPTNTKKILKNKDLNNIYLKNFNKNKSINKNLIIEILNYYMKEKLLGELKHSPNIVKKIKF